MYPFLHAVFLEQSLGAGIHQVNGDESAYKYTAFTNPRIGWRHSKQLESSLLADFCLLSFYTSQCGLFFTLCFSILHILLK